MKTELQQNLLSKYPEFFSYVGNKFICTGEKPLHTEIKELFYQKETVLPIQFGFECGDGWYMILDELMQNIQDYIEFKNKRLDEKFKFQFLWHFQRWIRFHKKRRQWKIKLADWIVKISPKGYPHIDFRINQVKEKFGGLCFYYSGGDDEISGMVRLAESLSYKICESCGSTHRVGQTKGWIYTICQSCLVNNKRAKDLIWVENK